MRTMIQTHRAWLTSSWDSWKTIQQVRLIREEIQSCTLMSTLASREEWKGLSSTKETLHKVWQRNSARRTILILICKTSWSYSLSSKSQVFFLKSMKTKRMNSMKKKTKMRMKKKRRRSIVIKQTHTTMRSSTTTMTKKT